MSCQPEQCYCDSRVISRWVGLEVVDNIQKASTVSSLEARTAWQNWSFLPWPCGMQHASAHARECIMKLSVTVYRAKGIDSAGSSSHARTLVSACACSAVRNMKRLGQHHPVPCWAHSLGGRACMHCAMRPAHAPRSASGAGATSIGEKQPLPSQCCMQVCACKTMLPA